MFRLQTAICSRFRWYQCRGNAQSVACTAADLDVALASHTQRQKRNTNEAWLPKNSKLPNSYKLHMGCASSSPKLEQTRNSSQETAAAGDAVLSMESAVLAIDDGDVSSPSLRTPRVQTPIDRPPPAARHDRANTLARDPGSRLFGPSAGLVGPCYGGEVLCFNGVTASQVQAARDSLTSLPQAATSLSDERRFGLSCNSAGALSLRSRTDGGPDGSPGLPRISSPLGSASGTPLEGLALSDRLGRRKNRSSLSVTFPASESGTALTSAARVASAAPSQPLHLDADDDLTKSFDTSGIYGPVAALTGDGDPHHC
jgi:hypothetical protein